MLLTRKNPRGGPALQGFPIEEDPGSGVLGYKLGYCEHGDPLYMRTIDVRHIVSKFGYSLDEYESLIGTLKPKQSLRERIIKFLGGKTE